MSATEVVESMFGAYREQDRAAAEGLLAPGLVFTSPQDDHIDRDAYLERCFPTADRFISQRILHLAEAGDGGVFMLYEYELASGGRYRNAEFITVTGGQISEIQVFFGGQY
jgi:ketosteroid isomerase-like protein